MTKATYDPIAQHYERVIGPLDRWVINDLRQKTLAKLSASSTVLEVGAGTGLNFRYYSTLVSGVASELSAGMLEIAQVKTRPSGVALVQSDVEELPFADNSFDSAFATLVFCSVEAPLAGLAEMRRVVKKDGLIVLLEHVRPGGLLGIVFDFLNLFTVRLFCDHLNRRTAKLAHDAGLEVLTVEKSLLGIINLITCRVSR